LGSLPKTIAEVVARGVPDIFAKTYSDEPFLRYVYD
jgi:hypothetical protein